MDANYVPPEIETRQVYGISLQQRRNDCKIDESLFQNIVTSNKEVSRSLAPPSVNTANPAPQMSKQAITDLTVATLADRKSVV